MPLIRRTDLGFVLSVFSVFSSFLSNSQETPQPYFLVFDFNFVFKIALFYGHDFFYLSEDTEFFKSPLLPAKLWGPHAEQGRRGDRWVGGVSLSISLWTFPRLLPGQGLGCGDSARAPVSHPSCRAPDPSSWVHRPLATLLLLLTTVWQGRDRRS